MKKSNYEILKDLTKNVVLIWKETKGITDKKVTKKMDNAMFRWLIELTDALKIWIDKGDDMTDGELILARTNLGSLVESWLKFYYCVFYIEYLKNPKIKKNKIVEPDKMSFEDLKLFSLGKLWDNKFDSMYLWIDKIQFMRNSIHAFNYRNIGTPREFLEDVDIMLKFVELIDNHLPPLEDYIQTYPYGYKINPYE